MDKVTVLFVDDEEDFRLLSVRQIRRIFKDYEFEFIEAGDAQEVLALLKGGLKPSIIVVDYAMPKISGIELLKTIDSEYQDLYNVPRILISGYIRYGEMKSDSQKLRCTFFEKNLNTDFYQSLCRHMAGVLGIPDPEKKQPV